MKPLLSISVLLFLVVQAASSQPTQTIRGRVFDQESHMPLSSTNVMILEAGPITGVITDEAGNFSIGDVPAGRYNIMISRVGYESFIMREVMVGAAKEVFLDVGMKELVTEMEGVTIAASVSKDQTINPMAGISARSFTVEETEKYAGSWGDPARMASNFAGVFPNGDIYNYIVIRGNSPYGLIWRLDGIPVPNPNHFTIPGATGGPISIINNKQLNQSDFMTSAFPAEYSNGVSGVFDLHMRNGNSQKREYVAEIGLMGLEVGAEGPFSKKGDASYLINLRASLLGLVDEYLWVGALPRYQDLSFKMNFPYRKGKLSVFGFGGLSSIEGIRTDSTYFTPGKNTQVTDESGASTGFVGLKHVHFIDGKSRIISDLSYSTSQSSQRHDSLLNDVLTRIFTSNHFSEDRVMLSSRLLTKIDARNSLNTGLSIENNFADYKFHNNYLIVPGTAGDSLVMLPPKNLKDNNLAVLRAHIEWKHRFTNALTLYTGLNYLHFFMNHSNSIEPRANLRWNFAGKHTLSAGYGLHSQLHPFFYYLSRTYLSDDPWDRNNYIETNRELGFTKSHHFAVGYDFTISSDLRFKAEVYRQQLFDVPVEERPSHFSLINMGAGLEEVLTDSLVNGGTGRNSGIELTLEKFLSNHLYFLLTASILDSKYKGSDGILRNTAFNGNFNANGLIGYELPAGENGMLDINIRLVGGGGRRIIPHDEERTLLEGEDVYNYDLAYESRMARYFRLDGRLGYKYNGRKARHEIGSDISNITNRPNEWSYRYDSDTRQIETIYQQGIFFYLFYRINF
jgi:hypothetical protein